MDAGARWHLDLGGGGRVPYYLCLLLPTGTQITSTVAVNGATVPQSAGSSGANWTYDPTSNSLSFTSNDPPALGDQIEISYPIGCQ